MATQNENYHDDDIVITGISGAFPNSDNFEEFKQNLLKGKDMISEVDIPGGTTVKGLIKTIDRFDYTFFHMNHPQAEGALIATRLLHEKAFEAVLDAGYNLQQIKGKKIAIICGLWEMSSENDPAHDVIVEQHDGNSLAHIFMCANRISYHLDVHGPSCCVNTACSSSAYALDMAIKYIQSNQCEGAIVCSANFSFSDDDGNLSSSVIHSRTISSPFDAKADGYNRSEAAIAMFLQKRKYAKRIYANVIHSLINCEGYKADGITHPSISQQRELYEQFYETINIDPRCISYIEAHGTGTQVGDIVEGASIEEFFCQGREAPLKIGSVKSNMGQLGHAEGASALCSIAKLIVAFETGTIPSNLNFTCPNPNIKGLLNGRLQIVTEPTPLEGHYFALNSFGIGGANSHILLSPHNKIKQSSQFEKVQIPKILTVSGRTEEAVDSIFNDIEKHFQDEEYVALLHEIFSDEIRGHHQRGFIILHENKDHTKSKTYFSGEKRPIWFVFAGMGSQWSGMAKSLMSIPIFAESIKKSHQIMQSKQIDLIKIITDDDPKIFDNVLNSFVGIAAVQIALVDVLQAIGIRPDGIIGHSVGELGCAYADGCFTSAQMILAAYYRGLVSVETKLIHGMMAAVGASYETLKELVTSEIDIACHNGPTSCTISGPTPEVEQFIETLKEKNIFVRPVNSSNIAYHSRYITPLGQKLSLLLNNEVVSEPKLRSKKWICTSAPEHKWDTDQVKYSSAEYHTNNLLSPVLFEEGCRHIPRNAITIEIAPHGLLQAVLKRSLPETVTNIPLTLKNNKNGVEFLLNSLGRMYEAGCVPKLSALYPPVEFPVSRSTPTISSLIKWQHDEQWSVGKLEKDHCVERVYDIRTTNDKYKFIKDHVIDGRNLYPGMGYLWLVIEAVSHIRNKKNTKMPVVFENVRFERVAIVPEKDKLKLLVSITAGDKYFNVTENGQVLVSGTIRVLENVDKEMMNVPPVDSSISKFDYSFLNANDFYKELRLRGYQYKGSFRQVDRVNYEGTYGEILWNDNFVTFMDNMAQLQILSMDTRELLIPTFVRKIVIDFEKHYQQVQLSDKDEPRIPVHFYPRHRLVSCGGIQMIDWCFKAISRQKNLAEPVLEKYDFVPYINDEIMELSLAIHTCTYIAFANILEIQVKTYELVDHDNHSKGSIMSSAVWKSLNSLPTIQPNVTILTSRDQMTEIQVPNEINISTEKLPNDKSSSIIILSNISHKMDMLENIHGALKEDGFLITKEPADKDFNTYKKIGFNVCFSRKINETERILLLNKMVKNESVYKAVEITSNTFGWVTNVQNELAAIDPGRNEKLVIYAEKDPKNGILGFFNTLRKEEKGKNLRCVYTMDKKVQDFSLEHSFYRDQLDKNLCQNVYKNSQWGAYCHFITDPVDEIETTHAQNIQEERGDFSSFKWIEISPNLQEFENSQKNTIHVYYSSLNFRDVMITSGRMSAEDLPSYHRLRRSHYGFEYSGKDDNGTRWMGTIDNEAIATTVQPRPDSTWEIPDHMSLEEAATIPVLYATVVTAFFFKMNLQKSCSVLIHAGSGGIGQAAINICLHYECEIFTTVGTAEKVQFIRKTFPQIPESHIGNSRDTSFEQLIMEQTKGRGVDVVLNSLAEEKMQASVRCLAYDGHFLEIGRYDMLERHDLSLGHFVNNISFHSIQLGLIMKTNRHLTLAVKEKVTELLKQGVIKPIQRTIFQADEVESAFRFMASGKHTGKVLIKINDEENDYKVKPILKSRKCKPQVHCSKYSSYVIVGGLGGIGMELADWLILRGARNIVLSSRSGIKNGYQAYRIKLWRSYGVKIVIFTEDVTNEKGASNLLQTANTLGPVEGIFNLAMILKDDPFMKQTEENFSLANGPKAVLTMHLDNLSRKMCQHLKYFIVFSSAVSGLGNQNQSNYAYANSAMERICEIRHKDGLPSLAIQWGAVGDVGIVAEFQEQALGSEIIICGALQQKIKSCLNTLNTFMKQPSQPIVTSIVVAEKRHSEIDITGAVANVLGIKDLKTINQSWTFSELGMDSVLALELKQILELEFNVIFSPEDLQTMTFVKLLQMKKEKENSMITGEKIKTQMQTFMEEILLNKPIRRIPLDENNIEKSIVFDENPTIFMFPGAEGLAVTMQSLAKNLPGQVICFQYYFGEVADYTFEELRDYFAKKISI
ncbi:fatty acid synthase-like [Planococcus citri]|uniref:fatty acid synthase-like n=1 Tax=Planococcus citri TaxID=170843 RepID=UPI0031F88D85